MAEEINVDDAFEVQELNVDDAFKAPRPKERGTNLAGTAKQAAAGVFDVAAAIPALFAMGGNALASTYQAATGEEDFLPGLVSNFEKNMEKPIQRELLGMSHAARQGVNRFFGLQEPKLLEDQAVRLLSSTVIPAIGPLSHITKGKNALALLTRLVTPLMKVTRNAKGSIINPGNVLRFGTQAGLATGIEQGSRNLFPSPEFPLMLSDEAILGGLAPDTGGLPSNEINVDDAFGGPQEVNVDEIFESEESLEIAREMDRRSRAAQDTADLVRTGGYLMLGFISIAGGRAILKKVAANAAAKGPLGSVDPTLSVVEQMIKDVDNAPLGQKFGKGYEGVERYVHQNFADANQAMLAELVKSGASAESIARVLQDTAVNWRGVAQDFHNFGFLHPDIPQLKVPLRDMVNRTLSLDNTIPKHRIAVDDVNVQDITLTDRQLMELTIFGGTEQSNRVVGDSLDLLTRVNDPVAELGELKKLFDDHNTDGMARWLNDAKNKSQIEDIKKQPTPEEAIKYEADDGSGNIWQHKEVLELRSGLKHGDDALTNEQLQKIIKLGMGDAEIKQMSRDINAASDALLDYLLKMKVIDQVGKDRLIRRFTMTDASGTPRRVYVPLTTANSPTAWARFKQLFGFRTSAAEEADVIKNLLERGVTHGRGTAKPVNLLEAMQRYSQNVVEHANVSAHQMNILSQLSKIHFDPKQNKYVMGKLEDGKWVNDKDAKSVMTNRLQSDQPQYVGAIDIDKVGTKLEAIEDVIGDGRVKLTGLTVKDPTIVQIQHRGQLHLFRVPDPGVRAGIAVRPILTPTQEFFNTWKNYFTDFVTGNKSGFFLAANQFSTQTIALNSVARSGKTGLGAIKEGLVSNIQSIKGTFELTKVNVAKELSDFLSQRIYRDLRKGKDVSKMRVTFRDALDRRIRDSIATAFQRAAGKTNTSIASTTEMAGSASANFAKFEGDFVRAVGLDQMNLMWRTWKAWNAAWHEGPALGAQMRHYGEAKMLRPAMSFAEDLAAKRAANVFARTVAGDMQRLGASQAAVHFNASVPFSAAMIQSWNALGSALKHNPKKFIAGATALIAIPTVSEMTWNALISSEDNTWVRPEDHDEFGNPKPGAVRWTHNAYYHKFYTAQQRNSSFIYMNPFAAPWNPITYPVSPEWGLMRGIVMDSMDALVGFSDIKGMENLSPQQASTIASLHRVTDIPCPPIACAVLTAITGQDIRAGINFEDDGSVTLIKGVPLGRGQRATASSVESKNINGVLDNKWAAVITELGGAGASAYMMMQDSFFSGLEGKEGGVGLGIERAISALGVSAQKQMKWTSPIFSHNFNTSLDDEAGRQLRVIQTKIKELVKVVNDLETGGVGNNTVVYDGNGAINALSDDPLWQDIAVEVVGPNGLKAILDAGNDEVSGLRRDINVDHASTNISVTEAVDRKNGKSLQIRRIRARQMGQFDAWRTNLETKLTERYRRPITIDFGDLSPRAKAGN
jgi:hypothetical protein